MDISFITDFIEHRNAILKELKDTGGVWISPLRRYCSEFLLQVPFLPQEMKNKQGKGLLAAVLVIHSHNCSLQMV